MKSRPGVVGFKDFEINDSPWSLVIKSVTMVIRRVKTILRDVIYRRSLMFVKSNEICFLNFVEKCPIEYIVSHSKIFCNPNHFCFVSISSIKNSKSVKFNYICNILGWRAEKKADKKLNTTESTIQQWISGVNFTNIFWGAFLYAL